MVSSPLTERWMANFCTDELSNYYDLEYWDCSDVSFPKFNVSSSVQRDYVRKIRTRKELIDNLKRLPSQVITISDVHFVRQNYSFYKSVANYIPIVIRINFWSAELWKLPKEDITIKEPYKKETLFAKIKHSLYKYPGIRLMAKSLGVIMRESNSKIIDELNSLWKTTLHNYWVIKINNLFDSCIGVSTKQNTPGYAYSINHPDYDKYLSLQEQFASCKKKYILFIDQFFPLHPDLLEEEPNVNHIELVKPFYDSLNRFFDDIEEKLGMPVVIAGHPSAHYEYDVYNGRKVIFFKTCELIRDSYAVCMQYSNSIAYVALFDKPVAFIQNSASMQSKFWHENIKKLTDLLEEPIVEIDKEIDWPNLFHKLNPDKRKEFLNLSYDINVTQKNTERYLEILDDIHSKYFSK